MACHVMEQKVKGFAPKASKAYLLNYSDAHCSGCYDVLCCRTNRVRQSVDVTFPDQQYLDDVKAPDTITLELTTPPVKPLYPKTYVMDTFFQHSTPAKGVWTSVPAGNIQLTETVKLGDVSKCKAQHTRERCHKWHNKTVADILKTPVPVNDQVPRLFKCPNMTDVKCSVNQGNTTVYRFHKSDTAHTPVTPDTVALTAVPTPELQPTPIPQQGNDEYVDPRTSRVTYIHDQVGLDITATFITYRANKASPWNSMGYTFR